MQGLIDSMQEYLPYRKLLESIRNSMSVQQTHTLDGVRPIYIASLWHHLSRPLVVITPRAEDARHLLDSLLTYVGNKAPLHLFAEPEILPYERVAYDSTITNQRLATLASLVLNKETSPPSLIISSVSAALRYTLPVNKFQSSISNITLSQALRLDETMRRWVSIGYKHETRVDMPGTFSQRGGILDIYPPTSHLPVRIEMVGNTVDTIRLFDPSTQRSVENVDSVTITPSKETLPALINKEEISKRLSEIDYSDCHQSVKNRTQNELSLLCDGHEVEDIAFYAGFFDPGCLLDYVDEKALVIMDKPSEIKTQATEIATRGENLRLAREARGELPSGFPSPLISWNNFQSKLKNKPRLSIHNWTGLEEPSPIQLPTSYHGDIGQFIKDVNHISRQGWRVVVVSRHARRLAELFEESEIGVQICEKLETPPEPNTITVMTDSLPQGWLLPLESQPLALFTDTEVFGTVKQHRPHRSTRIRKEITLSEIEPGGYVVHVDHGIAKFSGTTKITTNNNQKEYLVLKYAANDKLYVPTDQLDRVSRYTSASETPPKLTRLGTTEWIRIKDKAQRSAKKMAQELTELYAARQRAKGISFSPDSIWQQELEEAFPYEETPDQERTIREVKQEMELNRPVDRLVCGDVGYGKTEIALRAAFKAIQDGYQVAILVPTTVLAQQHFSTFNQRLAPFPVNLEVLSRLRTQKEQKEIVKRLREGTLDVVIGTHRLLQKDVKFKKLGLVVIDEEQRFGVSHKERFKQMRKHVDILTLSATPIPRTLYMSLSGIRDMSTMETPPEERLPVKTYVSEYNDELIKQAILREMERGGQVFYLHNRVKSIRRVAENIRNLIPQARVGLGHGRMLIGELETTMRKFTEGRVDVLVCTTIIESGLDIPNANTIIIDRADRFGLSQLYQLRGRVGRTYQRAHCYLLIPHDRNISPTAVKRLNAILESSDLGSGFRIAMKDLEIRGAGNILGAEQSGHLHAVGFEMYNEILREAVREITTTDSTGHSLLKTPITSRIDLPMPSYIPETYIPHTGTRIEIYQRLAKDPSIEKLNDLGEELMDRFGPLPEPVQNLLYLVRLKLLAQEAGVKSVRGTQDSCKLTLAQPVVGASIAFRKALGPGIRIGNEQIHVNFDSTDLKWQIWLVQVMERIVTFRQQASMLSG